MWIIAGLGNPGLTYRKSRHNAGFQALDAVAEKTGIRVHKKGFSGTYGEGTWEGERLVLIKPSTYMNLSGDCIRQVTDFYKVPVNRLIVLYDDIDLPVGSLRIRGNGSAGTHNGMRSVVGCMGGQDFPRIRIGVGEERKGELKDFVLSKPSKDQQKMLEEVFAQAADAALLIVAGKLNEAQAKYNKRHEGLGN